MIHVERFFWCYDTKYVRHLTCNSLFSSLDTPELTEKNFSATAFRTKAAIATALGAAAARSKLLADQEEREMELLMASVIEAQVSLSFFNLMLSLWSI